MSKLTGGKTNHQKQNQAIDTPVYLNQRQKFQKEITQLCGCRLQEKVRQNEMNEKKKTKQNSTHNTKLQTNQNATTMRQYTKYFCDDSRSNSYKFILYSLRRSQLMCGSLVIFSFVLNNFIVVVVVIVDFSVKFSRF